MFCDVHQRFHDVARSERYTYRGLSLCFDAIREHQIRGAEDHRGKPVQLPAMTPRLRERQIPDEAA